MDHNKEAVWGGISMATSRFSLARQYHNQREAMTFVQCLTGLLLPMLRTKGSLFLMVCLVNMNV